MASGHYIGEVTSTADDVVTQFVVYLVGLVFEWRFGTSTTNAADLTWDGFYLPKGM